MPSPRDLHDVACVVHLHSTYSDGTGTVPEIAAAARTAGVDVVLLTDHDTLAARRRGEERWYGSALVLVGEEISPPDGNHYLAFDLEDPVDHRGLAPREICAAVEGAGGFGFAAHPFSRGSERFRRHAGGMPWEDLEDPGLVGLELWSFVTDSAEALASVREAIRFVVRPESVVDHPPERNMAEWDRLCANRRVVAIGGLDAHQFGRRIRGRVPLRLMSYARSFGYLRTHVLCRERLSGDLEADRAAVYESLRAGRCYLAMDKLAPARGFEFCAERDGETLAMGAEAIADRPRTLRASVPRAARLRLLRDGELVLERPGRALELETSEAGVYRVEARLASAGRDRTWIVSNPIYLRRAETPAQR